MSDLGVSTMRQWRSDFEEVLAALRAGGASVELNGAHRRELLAKDRPGRG